MPHQQQVPTTSTYRILGPPQELDRTVAVPAYPRASRSQRRRKRNNKRKKSSKNRPRTNSSSSGEDRRKGLPMPHVIPTLEETDDAPQVLLWHSNRSSVRRSSGSSGGEDNNNNKEEERNTTSSSDIFRYQTVRRQGPDDMELVQHVQQHEPLDLLAPRGPQWFQWEYWRERLFERRCCLPERTTSLKRREPLIDYRPSYLGRDHAIYTSSPWGGPVRQQQQHYYVMPQWPPPQISPLTDAGMTFAAFSPIHEHLMKPSAVHYSTPNNRSFSQAAGAAMAPQETTGLPEDFLAAPIDVNQKPSQSNNKSKAGKRKKHHRKSSSLLGTHYEVPPTNLNPIMDPVQETKAPLDPVMDAQSVSSLDSNWKTPVQQQFKVVIPPDTNTTEASNNSAMSNRLKGIRRSLSRSSSPRPGSNLKPPVPPPRRQSSSGSKHKVQITNSTVASTALPPLPSPPSHMNGIPIPTGVRERSFSEASANTNGSRHRRGGTVCEFSFESLSMNPTNSTTNAYGPSKPPRSSIRSSSLPLEVQIQVHVPTEEPIRMVDSKDSWGVTPPKSYFVEDEEGETPEGYISPLEEEQFTLLVASSPGGDDRTNTTTSPREVTSTASEAYAGDIDSPQTTTSTSNPQDSLCGDDSRGDEENNPHVINFEQTSPFAKLKDPPSIPPGESWMWSWVNKKDNSNGPKTPVVPLTGRANAVTPTQSPSSAGSSSSSSGEKETPKPRREYLPKDPTMEQSWRSQHATTASHGIAVSGWMAFGLGEDMVKMLLQDGTNLERSNIAYVVLPNGSEQLWVSKLDGSSFDSIDLSGCRVEVHEISREHGRAIYLKRKALGETLCTLLPVCLPEEYNGDEAAFGDGSLCFPKGDYLPDDQQYTTMHIMFALDALLKSKENFAI